MGNDGGSIPGKNFKVSFTKKIRKKRSCQRKGKRNKDRQ